MIHNTMTKIKRKKMTKNDLQNITHITNDRATETPQKEPE
jgi:hypothetical protein